jgi:hypothetical protein
MRNESNSKSGFCQGHQTQGNASVPPTASGSGGGHKKAHEAKQAAFGSVAPPTGARRTVEVHAHHPEMAGTTEQADSCF